MTLKKSSQLYDCLYVPPELPAQKNEIEECHKALVEVLEKPERRLAPQIIDAKDRIVEDTSIDSFISGFTLVWKLSVELNNFENERLVSYRTGRLGARFALKKEEPKWKRESSLPQRSSSISPCVPSCSRRQKRSRKHQYQPKRPL